MNQINLKFVEDDSIILNFEKISLNQNITINLTKEKSVVKNSDIVNFETPNLSENIQANITAHDTSETAHEVIVNKLTQNITAKADKSSIPTKLSELNNDASFVTESQLPVIPTNVSSFVNDSNYVNSSEITTTLDNYSNISLNNLNTSGKKYISELAMPSNHYEDITLGANGTSYTAPANGYICFAKNTTAAGQYIQLNAIPSNGLFQCQYSANPSQLLALIMPLKAGQIVYTYYTAAGAVFAFRFVYASGEKG